MKNVPIFGPPIFLREFSPEDAPKVFAMSVEAGMKRWIPDQVYADEARAREVLTYLCEQYKDDSDPRNVPLVLGICLEGSRELVGHVGISPLDEEVEIGYAIEDRHQRKGYASKAIVAMSRWAFRNWDLPHLLGMVDSENVGSSRTLERSGFSFVEEKMQEHHGVVTLVKTYKLVNGNRLTSI